MTGSGLAYFTAVTAASPTSAWAFSSNENGTARTVAWRLVGSTWTQAPFPAGQGRVDLARSPSSGNVWAFTDAGHAVRWNGCSWAVVRGFPGRNVSGAAVISASDVWVFGQRYSENRTSGHATWHYNGRTWTRWAQARGLADASAVSASDIWAYGASWTASATVIAHWNGSTWQRTSVASLLPARTMYCGPSVNGIYGVSPSDAWAVGSALCQDVPGPSLLLHLSGGRWHRVAMLGLHVPVGVYPDGHGGLWIPVDGVQVPRGEILHYSRGVVTSAPLPIPPGRLFIIDAAAAPRGAAFAVGQDDRQPGGVARAVILRYWP